MIIRNDQVGYISMMQGWFNIWKDIKTIHYINKLKEKKHTIILVDGVKAFDKIQHSYDKSWKDQEFKAHT